VGPRRIEPSKGRSGIGLLAFGILATVLVAVVAAIALAVGHQVGVAEQSLRLLP
jgi:hypothetical protein